MVFDLEGVVGLLLFAFWIWCIFDCIGAHAELCRNLPKGVWLILILLIPDIGGLAWLIMGRPERAGWRPGSTDYASPRRPLGIEDHPRYSNIAGVSDARSAELDRKLEQWEQEQAGRTDTPAAAPAAQAAATPAATPATPATGDRDLDAWQADLDRREADLRRRELEQRQRELDERDRRLDDA